MAAEIWSGLVTLVRFAANGRIRLGQHRYGPFPGEGREIRIVATGGGYLIVWHDWRTNLYLLRLGADFAALGAPEVLGASEAFDVVRDGDSVLIAHGLNGLTLARLAVENGVAGAVAQSPVAGAVGSNYDMRIVRSPYGLGVLAGRNLQHLDPAGNLLGRVELPINPFYGASIVWSGMDYMALGHVDSGPFVGQNVLRIDPIGIPYSQVRVTPATRFFSRGVQIGGGLATIRWNSGDAVTEFVEVSPDGVVRAARLPDSAASKFVLAFNGREFGWLFYYPAGCIYFAHEKGICPR